MKSLGKQNILVESFYNGNPAISIIDTKTVYQNSKGKFFAKYSKKEELTKIQPAKIINGYTYEYELKLNHTIGGNNEKAS